MPLKPIVTSIRVHLILVEEIVQPKLDEMLRYKIVSDFFYEWLKGQIEQFEVEFDDSLAAGGDEVSTYIPQNVS